MTRARRTALVAIIASVALSGVLGRAPVEALSPPARPGTIVRAEPFTAYVLPHIPLAARAWRVLYRSTDALGRPITVSGVILVPNAAWTGRGPRPLVGYTIGSQGLADRCAPSAQLAGGTEYEAAEISEALSHGWAIALTDYPGLGTPGDHPYVVGRELGRSVLDVMRAALRLPADGLAAHPPLAVFGYSEGGEAAGWAFQLQPTYARDLPLRGGAVGAAPANFFREYAFLDGGGGQNVAFLLLYAALGFNTAYPNLHLAQYLNANGRTAVARLENTCIEDAVLDGLTMPKDPAYYETASPLTSALWRARFRENNLGTIAPREPVILGAAREDEAIAPDQTRTLYHQWCALGVNAQLDDIPVGEHISGGVEFAPAPFRFLADRLAGKALPRAADCARAQ